MFRRGLPQSIIIAPLEDSLQEIRNTCGVSKEALADIVHESWLEWGLGQEGGLAPRSSEADIPAAHDSMATNSRKVQQTLDKLVNQGRHAAHAASMEELPEPARPLRPGDHNGGTETNALAKASFRIQQGAVSMACLRARPTGVRPVIPAKAFVGKRR